MNKCDKCPIHKQCNSDMAVVHITGNRYDTWKDWCRYEQCSNCIYLVEITYSVCPRPITRCKRSIIVQSKGVLVDWFNKKGCDYQEPLQISLF